MLGDHCGPDAANKDATLTISHEVGKDEAVPLAKSFAANGGEMMEEPSMQFWGQGEGDHRSTSGRSCSMDMYSACCDGL